MIHSNPPAKASFRPQRSDVRCAICSKPRAFSFSEPLQHCQCGLSYHPECHVPQLEPKNQVLSSCSNCSKSARRMTMDPPPRKRPKLATSNKTKNTLNTQSILVTQQPIDILEDLSDVQLQEALVELSTWVESGNDRDLGPLLLKIQTGSTTAQEDHLYKQYIARAAATISAKSSSLQTLSRNISPPPQHSKPSSPSIPSNDDKNSTFRNIDQKQHTKRQSLPGSEQGTTPPASVGDFRSRNFRGSSSGFGRNVTYPRQPKQRPWRDSERHPSLQDRHDRRKSEPKRRDRLPLKAPSTQLSYLVISDDDDVGAYPAGTRFEESDDVFTLPTTLGRQCTICKQGNITKHDTDLCPSCELRNRKTNDKSADEPELMVMESPSRSKDAQERSSSACQVKEEIENPLSLQGLNRSVRPSSADFVDLTDDPAGNNNRASETNNASKQSESKQRDNSNIDEVILPNAIDRWRQTVPQKTVTYGSMPPPSLPGSAQDGMASEDLNSQMQMDNPIQLVKSLKDKNEDLKSRVKNLENSNKSIGKELADKTTAWEFDRTKLENELRVSRRIGAKAANSKDLEAQELRKQLRRTETQLQDLKKQQPLEQDHKAAQQKLEEVQAIVSSKGKEITDLKRERVFLQKDLEAIRESTEAGLASANSARRDSTTPAASNLGQDHALDDATELRDLRTQYKNYRRESRRTEKTKNDEIKQLQQELQDLKNEFEVHKDNSRLHSFLHDEQSSKCGQPQILTPRVRQEKTGASPCEISQAKVAVLMPPSPDSGDYVTANGAIEFELSKAKMKIAELQQDNKRLQQLYDGGGSPTQYHRIMHEEISFVRNLSRDAKIEEIKQRPSRKDTFGELGMDHLVRSRGQFPHVSKSIRKQSVPSQAVYRDPFETGRRRRRREPNVFVQRKVYPSKQKRRGASEDEESEFEGSSPAPNPSGDSPDSSPARGKNRQIQGHGGYYREYSGDIEISSEENSESESGSEEEDSDEQRSSQEHCRNQADMDEMTVDDEGVVGFRSDSAAQKHFENTFNVPQQPTPVVDGRKRLSVRTGQKNHKGEVPRAAPFYITGRKGEV